MEDVLFCFVLLILIHVNSKKEGTVNHWRYSVRVASTLYINRMIFPSSPAEYLKGRYLKGSQKYLSVHLDNNLDQSLFFLRTLSSLDICSKIVQMFYQSKVANVLFYAAAC